MTYDGLLSKRLKALLVNEYKRSYVIITLNSACEGRSVSGISPV